MVKQHHLGPRLGDHPHDTLRHVLKLNPAGHAAELGVYKGDTLRLIAAHMPVTGFDSFKGLPEDWRPNFPAGRFVCPTPTIPNAEIIVGMFADTLPKWKPPAPLGLLHIDCDLYSSTATALNHLGPLLRPGTYIVFDEFHGYPGSHEHEARAWREYVSRTRIKYDIIGHGPEQWAIRVR